MARPIYPTSPFYLALTSELQATHSGREARLQKTARFPFHLGGTIQPVRPPYARHHQCRRDQEQDQPGSIRAAAITQLDTRYFYSRSWNLQQDVQVSEWRFLNLEPFRILGKLTSAWETVIYLIVLPWKDPVGIRNQNYFVCRSNEITWGDSGVDGPYRQTFSPKSVVRGISDRRIWRWGECCYI